MKYSCQYSFSIQTLAGEVRFVVTVKYGFECREKSLRIEVFETFQLSGFWHMEQNPQHSHQKIFYNWNVFDGDLRGSKGNSKRVTWVWVSGKIDIDNFFGSFGLPMMWCKERKRWFVLHNHSSTSVKFWSKNLMKEIKLVVTENYMFEDGAKSM